MSAPYEEVSRRHRKCGWCGKVFNSRKGCYDHMVAKHHPIPKVENFASVERKHKDEEPSYADLVIEARLNAAMGLPVDDDLSAMFHDDIYG